MRGLPVVSLGLLAAGPGWACTPSPPSEATEAAYRLVLAGEDERALERVTATERDLPCLGRELGEGELARLYHVAALAALDLEREGEAGAWLRRAVVADIDEPAAARLGPEIARMLEEERAIYEAELESIAGPGSPADASANQGMRAARAPAWLAVGGLVATATGAGMYVYLDQAVSADPCAGYTSAGGCLGGRPAVARYLGATLTVFTLGVAGTAGGLGWYVAMSTGEPVVGLGGRW